ncbi:hypothetical protein PCE1_003514 [Barthelona sp. PCE]
MSKKSETQRNIRDMYMQMFTKSNNPNSQGPSTQKTNLYDTPKVDHSIEPDDDIEISIVAENMEDHFRSRLHEGTLSDPKQLPKISTRKKKKKQRQSAKQLDMMISKIQILESQLEQMQVRTKEEQLNIQIDFEKQLEKIENQLIDRNQEIVELKMKQEEMTRDLSLKTDEAAASAENATELQQQVTLLLDSIRGKDEKLELFEEELKKLPIEIESSLQAEKGVMDAEISSLKDQLVLEKESKAEYSGMCEELRTALDQAQTTASEQLAQKESENRRLNDVVTQMDHSLSTMRADGAMNKERITELESENESLQDQIDDWHSEYRELQERYEDDILAMLSGESRVIDKWKGRFSKRVKTIKFDDALLTPQMDRVPQQMSKVSEPEPEPEMKTMTMSNESMDLRARLSNTEKELVTTQRYYQDREKELVDVITKLQTKQKDLDDLADLKQHNAELKADAARMSGMVKDAERNYNDALTKIRREHLDSLERNMQIGSLDAQNNELSLKNHVMEEQVQRLIREKDTLTDTCANLKAELTKLRMDHDEQRKLAASLDERVKSLIETTQKEKEEMFNKLESRLQTEQELNEHRVEEVRRMAELEFDRQLSILNSDKQADVQRALSEERAKLEKESHEKLLLKNKEFEDRLTKLMTEKKQLLDNITNNSRIEMENLKMKNSMQMTALTTSTEKQLNARASENDELRGKLLEKNNAITHLEEEVKKLTESEMQTKLELDETKAILDTLMTDVNTAQKKIERMLDEKNALEREMDELRNNCRDEMTKLMLENSNDTDALINKLKHDYESKIRELMTTTAELQAEKAKIENRYVNHEKDIEKMRAAHANEIAKQQNHNQMESIKLLMRIDQCKVAIENLEGERDRLLSMIALQDSKDNSESLNTMKTLMSVESPMPNMAMGLSPRLETLQQRYSTFRE